MVRLLRYVSVIACIVSTSVFGQDMHYTQWDISPEYVNPALAANYNGDLRADMIYRNQWREIGPALNTFSLGADFKINRYIQEFDAGFFLMRDQFAGFGLNTNKLFVHFAYSRKVKGHTLRGGLQLGMVLKSTDLQDQTFPTQWNYPTGEFTSEIFNGENNITEKANYFDLNFGLAWTTTFKDFKKVDKLIPTAGFAIHHLTMPNDSYYGSSYVEKLKMRFTFNAQVEVKINKTWTVVPKIVWTGTTKANNLVTAADAQYHLLKIDQINYIFAGLYVRNGAVRNNDMVAPRFGISFGDFLVSLAYDLNTSTLSHTNGLKSSVEIGVVYTLGSSIPQNLTIPCDRY